jgi:hypothetical protein
MASVRSKVRSWIRWALAYGLGRLVLRLESRRGNLVAQALVDPSIQDDPYPTYELIRATGPGVGGKDMTPAAISHAATKELLRSSAFGVGDGHGELPCEYAAHK